MELYRRRLSKARIIDPASIAPLFWSFSSKSERLKIIQFQELKDLTRAIPLPAIGSSISQS